MFCPDCGDDLRESDYNEGVYFCEDCGAKWTEEEIDDAKEIDSDVPF